MIVRWVLRMKGPEEERITLTKGWGKQ
jgi:hypothetical protein